MFDVVHIASKHGIDIMIPSVAHGLKAFVEEIATNVKIEYLKEIADELEEKCKLSSVELEILYSNYNTPVDFGVALSSQYLREKSEREQRAYMHVPLW